MLFVNFWGLEFSRDNFGSGNVDFWIFDDFCNFENLILFGVRIGLKTQF